jgi:hypothetical protein
VAAGLAETIRGLRLELAAAMEAGEDARLRFQIGRVQLDVTVAITREGGGDAGVRFGVVSFGAKGKFAEEATHHLSLSLCPVTLGANGQWRSATVADLVDGEPP